LSLQIYVFISIQKSPKPSYFIASPQSHIMISQSIST